MRRWKNSLPWIMLACFLCTAAMTVYAFRYQQERYEASYSFFALPARVDKDKTALESARMLARDCGALARTEAFRISVLASAASDGTCRVAVRSLDGTHILKVVVTGTDATITAGLANAAGQALMEQAEQKLGATSVETIEAAVVPERAAYPERAKQIALTAAGSFVFFSILGCLFGSKRQKARYGKALGRGLLAVGAVPDERKLVKRQLSPGRRGGKTTLYMRASARMVESLSDIALQLYAASREADARSVVLTSAADDGAQAAFSLLLSSTLAQQHARVLLVDMAGEGRGAGDLLGVRGSRDLTDYLCGEAALGEILLSTPIRGLSFIDDLHEGGGLSGLLSTSAFRQFAQAVRAEFDFVIFSARAADAADAGLAGMTADMTLLLVEDGKCDLTKLLQTAERLSRVVRRMEGVVFTRVPEKRL